VVFLEERHRLVIGRGEVADIQTQPEIRRDAESIAKALGRRDGLGILRIGRVVKRLARLSSESTISGRRGLANSQRL
jgi:hypothetical protein